MITNRLRKNNMKEEKQDDTLADILKMQIEFIKSCKGYEFGQSDFMTFRFFPWAKDSRTWKRIIENDMLGENILKTRIEGEGYSTKYFIRGENIIKYLKKYGLLKMSEIRRSNERKNKTSSNTRKKL